jgi:hypothetical protein
MLYKYDRGILKVAFIAILLYGSCKIQEASWETNVLTPLIKTSLKLSNVLDENTSYSDSSQWVHLVYKQGLYDLAIDSFFHFSDTSLKTTFKIDSLSLYSTTVNYPITLGTLARNAGPTGQLLLFLHGTVQVIPPIPAVTPGPVLINADTLFTSMTLNEGKLDLSLYNGLPIPIVDVRFELRNQVNNELLVSGEFPYIGVNTTESRTYDLAGKTVEAKLNAQLISLASPGSSGVPVLIDTSNAIVASLKVYDLHPSTANAIWPAQDLINDAFYFEVEGLPVELKETKIHSGKAIIKLFSTIQDSIKFSYHLPSAVKNGVPLRVTTVLPPAPAGGSSRFVKEEQLAGYNLDLSGQNGDSFNLMYNEIIGSVDSTGVMKTFSTSDSIFVELSFVDLRPSYARGFLNDTTLYVGPENQDLEVFCRIKSGNLDLSQARLNIDIENRIGVDVQIEVKDLISINNRTQKKLRLDGQTINSPKFIQRATDQNGSMPIHSTITHIQLDENNSNMTEFINNLPDQIYYFIELKANPNGNVSNHKDFIYEGEYLSIDLNLDIPLEISAKGLTLCDTVSMNLENRDISGIKTATLHSFFTNGFPLDARVELYVLDQLGNVSDTLIDGKQIIQAASLDMHNKVKNANETKLSVELDESAVQRFLKTKKLYVLARFDTKPDNTAVKIFSDYSLDFQMTADFIYSVE